MSAPRRPRMGRWLLWLTVIVLCAIWFIPTLGILVSSFRGAEAITTSGWWTALLSPFEEKWTLLNYEAVLGTANMANAFINSLIVTIPSTIIPITVAAFAAYAFAWMRFPFKGTLFLVVVALMVVPLQMALIPVQQFYAALNLNNTFISAWLAHTAFGLPLATFLLYNFISQLPEDLFETASIDGASHFQMFTRIVLPLSVPALAAFAIFQFLWVWNDLLIALVYLGGLPDQSVMTLELLKLDRQPRPSVALAHRGCVHHHAAPIGGVPSAPAVLRSRHPLRFGQGLS